MKLVFVHDHKFRLINNKMYSTGGLSDNAIIRYTNNFGDTTIIARIINEDGNSNKYSEIKNPKITIKNGIKLGIKGMEQEIEKADCIIVRMPSFLGVKAINLAKKLKKPFIVEVVACPWDSLWNHSIKGKIIAPYMTKVMKGIVKEATHVIYVTDNFLQNRYPTNGMSVNCSNVTLNEFDETVLKRRLDKIELNSEKIILGTTAALNVRHKGQQYIIEALGELKKQGITNYEYQLVGGGDTHYLKNISKKFNVEDQVKFLGPKPHKEVFEWLESIDIYVQPSRQEGLPRALIEAMSRGLPAFGAKTGGIPELINSNMLFSNTKQNIEEILKIINSFDIKTLKDESINNFKNSNKYRREFIDKRRNEFFHNFKNSFNLK